MNHYASYKGIAES